MNDDRGRAGPLGQVLLLALLLVLFTIFLSRFVLVEMLLARIGAAWLAAAASGLAIVGTATLARRALRDSCATPSLASDFVLGYPLFGVLCFLAGLVSTGVLAMLVVAAIPFGAGIWRLRSRARPAAPLWSVTGISIVAVACLTLAFALSILSAQLPPTSLDELAYHLAIPKLWVAEGRVVELPLLSHSYFPLGIESADLPLFALLGEGGALASHALHLLAACATALVLYRSARKRISPERSLLLTAAVATTPALLITAGWSWVDWPLVGIAVVLFDALDALDGGARGRIALALAAGLLTKYTFLPLAVCLVAALLMTTTERRPVVRPLLIGLGAGSVFFLRNLVLTGNPLAPFFDPLAPEVRGYRDSAGLGSYLFDGKFIDESLGVTLLLLAAASLLGLRFTFRTFHGAATLLLGAATLLLFTLAPSARILLPFLVLLAIAGMHAIEQASAGASRAALLWSLGACCVVQLFLVAHLVDRLAPFTILSGRLGDEDYAASMRKSALPLRWAASRLPPDSRTLVIGINELFWFPGRVRGGGNFDSPRISAYLERGSSRDLLDALRANGITHLLVHAPGVAVGGAPSQPRKEAERETWLSPLAAERLREMLQTFATPIAEREGARVFALR